MEKAVQINQLYQDITRNITQALDDIAGLDISNDEGKAHVSVMTQNLQQIRKGFEEELLFLQQHAEWDHFTLAFFGETNAGKSTLIESLRILFNEQARQQALEARQNEVLEAERQLAEAGDKVREGMKQVYQQLASALSDFQNSAQKMKAIQLKTTRTKLLQAHITGAAIGLCVGLTGMALYFSQAAS